MIITGIIIAKNEEETIHLAIDSLNFCDEILVIDNESSDNTSEIAKKMGALVHTLKTNSFSELRNFGLKNSGSKYIFYLDADEVISEKLKESILRAVKSENRVSAHSMQRKNYYLGENEWPKTEVMTRLFLKDKLLGWKGDLHESPVVDGEIEELEGYIIHHTHKNLTQMLSKTIEWSETEAKLRYQAKHPKMSVLRLIKVMATAFLRYYIGQKGYKVGTAGLIESVYQSFSAFITYAKLWEMQRKN